MVEGGEEGRDDVVADVVVAERGELLAHGVDGDARQVAAHRWIRAARARESAYSHAPSERNNERCSLRNGPFLQHRMNISRGESTNESQEFDIHGGSRRALSTPSSRAPADDAVPRRGRPRREYYHHALSSSSSRRRVTAASPHDASRATTRTAGDAPSQPRRHARSPQPPSSHDDAANEPRGRVLDDR